MGKYNYRCTGCGALYAPDEIERKFIYLCPKCGSSGRNQPLRGVLQIDYDYNELKEKLSRAEFLLQDPGKFWLYPDLWPLERGSTEIFKGIPDNKLNRLSLNAMPVIDFDPGDSKVSLLDETRNPTLSYKDRASIITALKGIQLGVQNIAAASTGNAGSSIAGICARLGIKSHVFVPSSIPDAKRIQIQAFGSNIYMVDGTYDDAFDLCLEISADKKWYNRNTAYNPLTIEGKKSAAYDIFISTGGNIPDYIFVPVGDGVIISGIFKGFNELLSLGWIEKLPAFIAVQAEGSDALVRYLESGTFEFKTANTIADSISSGAPRNLYMAAGAVKESGGRAVTVSDEEILSAQKYLAKNCGLLSEPSSAASLAGYLNVKNELTKNDKILLLITGNGLKDTGSLGKLNSVPQAFTYSEWIQKFK